jgi:hypothetical protein
MKKTRKLSIPVHIVADVKVLTNTARSAEGE